MKSLLVMFLAAGASLAAIAPGQAADVTLVCRGGGGMVIENVDNHWAVKFDRSQTAANDQLPGPGQCAFLNDPMGSDVIGLMIITKDTPNALRMLAAAKGGTFQVDAESTGFFRVKKVGLVNVEDAEPVEEEAVEEAAVEVEDPVEGQDEQFAGGDDTCIGGVAIVSIPDPNDEYLNIRDRPNGKKIGKVFEDEEVNVIGVCEDAKAKAIWCRISEPKRGCVNSNFLVFDGGGQFDNGAGLARKR